MEWSNPGLIDLSMGGTDANKNCKDGGAPPRECYFGGVLNQVLCDGGGEIGGEPPDLCTWGDANLL